MNLKERLDLELQEFLSLNQDYSFDRMQRHERELGELSEGEESSEQKARNNA